MKLEHSRLISTTQHDFSPINTEGIGVKSKSGLSYISGEKFHIRGESEFYSFYESLKNDIRNIIIIILHFHTNPYRRHRGIKSKLTQ